MGVLVIRECKEDSNVGQRYNANYTKNAASIHLDGKEILKFGVFNCLPLAKTDLLGCNVLPGAIAGRQEAREIESRLEKKPCDGCRWD